MVSAFLKHCLEFPKVDRGRGPIASLVSLTDKRGVCHNVKLDWSLCSNNLLSITCKLTRNKNTRHIFLHRFFPVAMIGIICLYVHFVLYTLHTRKIFFKHYSTSGHMTITTQNARNLCQICDFDYEIPFFQDFFHVYSCQLYNFEWLYTSYFLTFY